MGAPAARAIEPLACLVYPRISATQLDPRVPGAARIGGPPTGAADVATGANFLRPPVTFSPSPAQHRAIEAPLGPVLVVAGPGAGKTFCLIGRIGHLIARHGLAPGRICAVTFTNKAADEIADRLAPRARARRRTRSPAGTLHALCLGLLRDHASAVGLRRGFGIADEEYQRRVLRRLRVRPERLGQLLGLFGRHRLQNTPLTPGDLELFRGLPRGAPGPQPARLRRPRRPRGGAAPVPRGRGGGDPRPLGRVLVDEFQDLSLAQYAVVTGICAALHRNCFAVGDDEQSIFCWTGADPAILERFRTISTSRPRWCSTGTAAAPGRSSRPRGGWSPATRRCSTSSSRPTASRSTASPHTSSRTSGPRPIGCSPTCCATGWPRGLDWGDYAVLYRQHRLGQCLETRLVEAGIPCRLARGQALRRRRGDRLRGGLAPRHPRARRSARGRGVRRAGAAAAADRAGAGRPPGTRAARRAPRLRPRDAPRRSRGALGLALHLPRGEPGGARPVA